MEQVQVQVPTGVVVSRRVARMVLWLLAQDPRLSEMEKGQVVFHFAGERGLTAEVVEKVSLV